SAPTHLSRTDRARCEQHDGHARAVPGGMPDAYSGNREARHGGIVARATWSGRHAAHVASEVDDQPVELVGLLEHQHVTAVAHQFEAGAGDELRNTPSLESRRQAV